VGGRLAAAAASGLSPFVGRERDLALIVDRWERAKQGAGQVVLVSGEAGIGKSRLIARFREQLAGEPHVWLEFRCSPYHRNSALYPVIVLLEQVIGLSSNDSPRERLVKLEEVLHQYAPDAADAVPLLASLLSISFEEQYTLPAMTPQRQKQLTLEALLGLLLAVAEGRQVVFLIEDLHWVDPSTLELLGLLINQEATSLALVLLSCRTEFVPPWPERGHMTHLAVSRLTGAEVETLVAGVDAGRELPSEILRQVVAKTDGIPLFAEELTKMVLEGDLLEQVAHGALAGAVPELAIPATLRDLLMARLDRLAAEKPVAHLAACIGRSFSYELLREVAPFDEETLEAALEQLTAAELIYARGLPPRATYLFKHALIQEAAHQSLLRSTRRQYHRRIAEAMEKRLPEAGQANPELLAQHFTEAGCSREAIAYWLQAAQRAITRSANEEAIAHLSRGIGLVAGLDDPAERVRQELVLQTLLGIPLVVSRGYAAPEVERALGRAHELTQQLEDAPALFEVLNGLRRFYLIRGNLERASELGARLAQLAEQRHDSGVTLYLESAQGAEALFRGRLLDARAHCERAIALYDAHPQRSDLLTFSEEVGATARVYASWTYWLLGYPERALRVRNEALAIAHEASHPNTLAFAYAFAAALHRLRGEPEETRECAETAIDVGTEQGLPFWVAMATMFRGWALTQRGQREDGIAEIRRGLDAWRSTGAELGRPFVCAMLAEACQAQGELAEASTLIDETLVIAEKSGERYYEPELCRIRGELRRAEEAPYDEVDRCFQRAIALARDSHARSLELRAVASRSRLLRDYGKRQEARRTLAPMLDGFTEGFDTRDLQEAQALLVELS
jgi:predicted ATPase